MDSKLRVLIISLGIGIVVGGIETYIHYASQEQMDGNIPIVGCFYSNDGTWRFANSSDKYTGCIFQDVPGELRLVKTYDGINWIQLKPSEFSKNCHDGYCYVMFVDK